MAMKYGKYLLEKQLAIGGMAEVFLAHQEGPAGFRKTLCIKRILPNFANDAAFIDMFLDEARTAAQLSHPNIVQIYELGESDGSYYIAMEYIRGPALSKVIRRLKQADLHIPLHYAAKIVANVCAGLEYAHTFTDSEGQPLHLVHRDISPDNVLVSFAGAVKMIDFGIAKAKTNQSKTQAGAVKGKFSYMSPEQIMGSTLDGRSDLFSLGIVLYELTTLRKPFGEDADLMTVSAIVNDPPPLPADMFEGYPPALQSVILRALAKDRRERFATAQEMQNELERFIHEQGEFLSERDIGNYMTRLFSQSPSDLETLRQLGTGVRMKLTGVPVVRAVTGVGADEETVLAHGTGQAIFPPEPETMEIERTPPRGAPADDPDATRQVRAVSEAPTARETDAPRSAGAEANVTRPTPRVEPSDSRTTAQPASGGSKKGLWLALGVVAIAAVVVGLWFAFGGGTPSTGAATTGTGSAGPVAVASDAVARPEDAGGHAARKDAQTAAPDSKVALAAPLDAGSPGPEDTGTAVVDSALPADTASGPSPDVQQVVDAAPADVAPPAPDGAREDAGQPPVDAITPTAVDAGAAPAAEDTLAAVDDALVAADVEQEPDETEDIQAAEGIESGQVRVTSEPATDVYWAGRKQGRTPLTLDLPAGPQAIKLRGPSGLRKTLSVTVQPDRQVTASFTAVRGVVAFEVPRGVLVFLNGTSLGAAPVKMQQVWEGEHTVELRSSDGRRTVRTVKITKDEPKVLVRHTF